MKHIWTVICEKSSVDQKTNLLSMFNCLEKIILTIDKDKTPKMGELVIPANFQLVSFWTVENKGEENNLKFKIEIISPKGTLLDSFENSVNVDKKISRLRNITNIQNLKINGEEGRYKIRISQKKEEQFILVSDLPLDIEILYKTPNFLKKNENI